MLSLCKRHWYYYLSFCIQIYNYLKVTLENLLEGILPHSKRNGIRTFNQSAGRIASINYASSMWRKKSSSYSSCLGMRRLINRN